MMRDVLKKEFEGDIEKLMISMGVQRYDAAVSRAREDGRLSTVPHAQKLLSHSTTLIEGALREWVVRVQKGAGRNHHAYKYIKQVPLDVAAMLAARLTIDGLCKGPIVETKMAQAVGRVIEEEARLIIFRREAYTFWKELQRDQRRANVAHKRKVFLAAARRTSTSFEGWGRRDRLIVGLVVLDLIIRHTDLIERAHVKRTVMRKGSPKWVTEVLIRPTDTAVQWMEAAGTSFASQSPVFLPVLDPPLEWTNNWDGGYHGLRLSRTGGLMRARRGTRHLLDHLTAVRVPTLFNSLNAVQNTPWVVNDNVLAVASHFWDLGSPVGGLPIRENEALPAKPPDMESNPEALKKWKRAAHAVYTRNAERVGHRLLASKTLAAAGLFDPDGSRFYFPMKIDFRGRAYPVPAFLEPQGSDLARGLLAFADTKRVTWGASAHWLSLHGANVFGDDKIPFDERAEWGNTHAAEIRAVAEDPLENRWWAEADKPWQFLAFCFEWAELLEQGYVDSRLPVAMDGSNNGLQIFSLLLRDPVGGLATNCLPSDSPNDIYEEVARRATAALRHVDEDWARAWLRFLGPDGLDRKAVKRPVMTLPYGVKKTTARDYLRDWYDEVKTTKPGDEDPCRRSIWKMADLIWECIEETVPLAVQAMEWLRSVARVAAKQDKPLYWTTPIGLKVGQAYNVAGRGRVVTTLGDGVTKRNATYPVDTDKQDVRKMMDAISPNLVHSLDASAMYLTVDKARSKGVTHFSMVHDSFATHAADSEILASCLREAYAEVFSGDFLMEFKRQAEEQLDVELPPPPIQGDMHPDVVKDSRYFFL